MCNGRSGEHHHEHGHILVPVMSRRTLLCAGGVGLGAALLAACGRGPDVFGDELDRLAATTTAPTLPEPTSTTVDTGGPLTTDPSTESIPAMSDLAGFDEFAESVKVSREGSWWLVESNGLPAHGMMKGITSWQQQVPVEQPYTGKNAWRLPAEPRMAETPVSGRTALYRGAIALAANGVPIFNALNNRGDDAFLFGELDEWGGHCGRADDYHYHIAPLHLTATTGVDKPIAWALDGFPLYGEREPDGSEVRSLDEYNGHSHGSFGYHYHGTRTYPYINGGLRGVVTVSGDQVEPQPRTSPFRPAGEPLRGATVTSFSSPANGRYVLTYSLNGGTGEVAYTVSADSVRFVFTTPDGTVTRETYARK